jgi:TP901 family phage tail tape measure protein
MTQSAKEGSESAANGTGKLFISLSGLIRLMEAQLARRFFGAMVTEINQAINRTVELNKKISEIMTIAQRSGFGFRDLGDEIARLSVTFNRPQSDVAEGVYQAFSNQVINASSQIGFMDDALRLSRISVSSTVDSVNLLSSAINAYSLGTFEAARVSNQFFETINLGRLRASDIANSLGRVTVVASQLGIQLHEVLGFLALTTQRGITPSESITQLSAIMQGLLRPSAELQEMFQSMGFNSPEQFIATRGFVGVLQLLNREAQQGSTRLGELLNNVRALRGAFGVTGGGLDDLIRTIEAIRNSGPGADIAESLIGQNIGEQFSRELNKINVHMERAFGEQMLATLLKIAEPFGGLAEVVKQLTAALGDLVNVGSTVIGLFTSMVSVGGNLKINLGVIIEAYLAYRLAVVAANFASTQYVTISNLVRESNAGILSSKERLRMAVVDYANGTNELGKAQERAAQSSALLRQRLLGIAATVGAFAAFTIVPALIFTYERQINNFLGTTRGFVDTMNELLERVKEQQQQALKDMKREDTEYLESFRNSVTERFQPLFNRMQALNQIISHMVRDQRTNWNRLLENLKRSTVGVLDTIRGVVSNLRSEINEAENQIKRSREAITRYADRDASHFFQQALGIAQRGSQNLMPQDRFNSQNTLIQHRLQELYSEIRVLELRGDRDSIESARRKYEEIRQLTTQQFNLELQQREELVQMGLAAPDRMYYNVHTGQYIPIVNANLNILQQRLQSVTAAERQSELAFQAMQQRQIQLNQAVLNFERQRETAIQNSAQALTSFNLLNAQGQLRPEFAGPGGATHAMNQFNTLAQNLRNAMQPVQLTQQQINSLQQQFGTQGAAIIQQRLASHQMSAQQILQLEQSVGAQRVALQQQIEREITAVQANQLATQILNQRNALVTQQTQALTARQNAEGTISTRVNSAISAIQSIGAAVNAHLPLLTNTNIGRAVINNSQQASQALATFSADRTNTNLHSATTAIAALRESFTQYLRTTYGNNLVPGMSITGNAFATQADNQLTNIMQNLNGALQSFQQADTAVTQAQQTLSGINNQLGQLPPELQAIFSSSNQVVGAVNQGNQILFDIRTGIDLLTARIGGLVPAQGGGFAQGGLIGGSFSSMGPDNTVISARVGEMVMNPRATSSFFPVLQAMNTGGLRGFSRGGAVTNTTNVGDVTIHVGSVGNPDETARAVMSRFRREVRRGNGGM